MFVLFKKLRIDKYVSSSIIFGLDIFISVVVSIFSLFSISLVFTIPSYSIILLLYTTGLSLISSTFVFLLLKTHKSIIRHSSLGEIWRLGVATLGKGGLMVLGIWIWDENVLTQIPSICAVTLDILLTVVALITARVIMIIAYDLIRKHQKITHKKCKNVLVYGVGSKSVAQIKNSFTYFTSYHANRLWSWLICL